MMNSPLAGYRRLPGEKLDQIDELVSRIGMTSNQNKPLRTNKQLASQNKR